jgi:hypothetical protein
MFSLRTLLIAVAIAAIGAVGLTTRNVWWASVMSTLTLVALLVAVVMAIKGNGPTRSTALTFSVCVGTYLGITLSGLFDIYASSLLTSRLLTNVWNATGEEPPQSLGPNSSLIEELASEELALTRVNLSILGFGGIAEVRTYFLQIRAFYVVGHCLWALLFGFLGACLATYLHRRANPPAPTATGASA